MSMTHIKRREREKEEIRQRIMDTALNIAVSEGWDAVTIRKIAEVIEYTPPIVYEHFKNKEDLFSELALMGFRILYKEYESVRQSDVGPRKNLLLLSVSYWDFAFKHKELYQLIFNFNRPIPSEEIEKLLAQTKHLFLELANNRKLAKELMFSWVCLLYGLVFNTMQMGLPPELNEIPPKDLFINIVQRFLDSI